MTDSWDRPPDPSAASLSDRALSDSALSDPALSDAGRGRLRLRGPSDVIDAVPYLLGFHPRDSLVLIGLDSPGPVRQPRRRTGTRIGVVARIDLADCGYPGLLERTVHAIVRPDTGAVIAVVFRDEEPEFDERVLTTLTDCVAEQDVELIDVLVVGAHRWRSALCDEPGECDEAGGYRRSDVPSPTALAATLAGMVARPDRADLVGLLEPAPGREDHLPALEAAAAARAAVGPLDAQRRRRADVRALFAATRVLPVLEDSDLIRFGVALTDIGTRDACWLAAESGRIDGDGLWRELARRLPSPYDAAPLFLTGWDQWRRGNGTLARVAAERALASAPDYSAAELLLSALHEGMDPFRTPRIRKSA